MKTTVKILSVGLFLAGGALVISSAFAAAPIDPTPSFEVAQTSGPQIGVCADSDCKSVEDCTGMSFGQCNSTWDSAVTVSPALVTQNEPVQITLYASDVSGVKEVIANIKSESKGGVGSVQLYDDGNHGDGNKGDDMYGNTWNVGNNEEGDYTLDINLTDRLKNASIYENQGTFHIGNPSCSQDTDCAAGEVCCTGSGLCGTDACSVDADCDDSNSGTTDTCATSECPSSCSNIAITECDDGSDGFCPSACTNPPDTNCFDTTPPTVNFIDPQLNEDEITTDTYEVLVEAVDDESDIASVTFLFEGTVMEQQIAAGADGYYHWIWDLASVPNSPPFYKLEARATNGVGIDGLDSRFVKINRPVSNNKAPTATITSPKEGDIVSGVATVIVDATDDTSVAEVRLFHIKAGLIGSETTSGMAVTANIKWDADSTAIAYAASGVASYAFEPKKSIFPFIPVAHAQLVEPKCETITTTTDYKQEIYARAYDEEKLWGESVHVTVITPIKTTSTICK